MTTEVVTYQFFAEANPSNRRCVQIAQLAPENPFYTYGFVQARRAAGAHPWILSLSDNDGLVTACTAFMTSGRLNRQLEIQSLPLLPPGDTFWRELRRFCISNKITELTINSFGAKTASIPVLGKELWRQPRTEYLLDLTKHNLWERLSSNHKRNIKRARKANIVIRQANDYLACQSHAHLVSSSMKRRKQRGEEVTEKSQTDQFANFVSQDTGILYQAVLNGNVISSILILTSNLGGYYHSAGTSPDGFVHGGSHLLVFETAEALRKREMTTFNLGGADRDQAGLIRFKLGFGAKEISLEAAGFSFSGHLTRVLTRILRTFS